MSTQSPNPAKLHCFLEQGPDTAMERGAKAQRTLHCQIHYEILGKYVMIPALGCARICSVRLRFHQWIYRSSTVVKRIVLEQKLESDVVPKRAVIPRRH